MDKMKTNTPTILDLIKSGETLISDGATGTYLQSYGLEPGGCPEELNETNPKLIKQMASDYFSAGSNLVLTNSFGANKFMLGKYGLEEKVGLFNQLSAEHAREKTPKGRYTLGSVGPSGEFLIPYGEISEAELYDSFSQQIVSLVEGGVDGIIIETMTAIEEAFIAVKAAKENSNLPVIVTMTFDKGPRGFFTMMGVTPNQAASQLATIGADIVGANCGNGIETMTQIAEEIRSATDTPTIIHSNAGIPVIRKGQIIYPETPRFMAKWIKKLADKGTNLIGGCCGTTPTHIESFSDIIRG